jgi:hypothetical protein
MATEQVIEQAAEHLEEAGEALEVASEAVSRVDPMFVKGLLVGAAIAFPVAFFWGYRWNKAKLRAEAFEASKQEIDQIREVYRASYKPPLEEVVEEKGYSTEEADHEERPTRPSVPVREARPVQAPQRNQDKGWNYEKELPKRNKNHPYVIHQDEFNERNNEYTQLTWTYYAPDNILVDEHDEVVVRPELTVGEQSLKRFGHGSDDENVVFVRNDRIEIEWEICRTLKSYEVEVLGLDGDESGTEDDDN